MPPGTSILPVIAASRETTRQAWDRFVVQIHRQAAVDGGRVGAGVYFRGFDDQLARNPGDIFPHSASAGSCVGFELVEADRPRTKSVSYHSFSMMTCNSASPSAVLVPGRSCSQISALAAVFGQVRIDYDLALRPVRGRP